MTGCFPSVGVKLKDIVEWKEISFDLLGGHRIAIDAFNTLYQFVTIIRQRDGTPLMDSSGHITSHLSGLLYRTARLVDSGVKPCYVFDGPPPEFKLVSEDRKRAKERAREKLEEARERGEEAAVRKYAKQAAKLKDYMIEDSKELLGLMGVPWVQAPSEGEAQAAHMAAEGDVWAVGSQDYDSLLFGAPRLVRNLTTSGRRKLPYKNTYVQVVPELLKLRQALERLGISREQLVCLSLLSGTDYNPGGIKGIGPKTGLKLVREKGCAALEDVEWDEEWPPADRLLDFFLGPPTTGDYELKWTEPDSDSLMEFLVERHDFSEKRVCNAVDRLRSGLDKGRQSGLEEWC